MGWFVMSPGTEFDRRTMLLTQTSQSDYEDLSRMDVLGLADTSENDQSMVTPNSKNSSSLHLKDGMKLGYRGEVIIQNYQTTNKEA